jgi:hypothetical protein
MDMEQIVKNKVLDIFKSRKLNLKSLREKS